MRPFSPFSPASASTDDLWRKQLVLGSIRLPQGHHLCRSHVICECIRRSGDEVGEGEAEEGEGQEGEFVWVRQVLARGRGVSLLCAETVQGSVNRVGVSKPYESGFEDSSRARLLARLFRRASHLSRDAESTFPIDPGCHALFRRRKRRLGSLYSFKCNANTTSNTKFDFALGGPLLALATRSRSHRAPACQSTRAPLKATLALRSLARHPASNEPPSLSRRRPSRHLSQPRLGQFTLERPYRADRCTDILRTARRRTPSLCPCAPPLID